MENPKIDWVKVSFADHARRGKDAGQTLDLIMLSWAEIDRVMRPLISKGGVKALFARSLESAVETSPWLCEALSEAPAMDLDALRLVLSKQDVLQFAAASDILLVHFHYLLTELVGLSLTDRLLRPVLDPLLNGTPTKDN
jgi:hypothetical protein